MNALERRVAERIRQRRTDLNIGQRTLAIRMRQRNHDWHHTTVQRTEAAKRPVRIAELDSLAAALRTSMAYLLGLDEQPDPHAEQRAIERKVIACELLDSLEDGELPGSAIRYRGEEIWLHTTGQVEGWLRSQLERMRGGAS